MVGILEVMSRVSHPLGVGGLALAVFLLIVRQLISRGVFPALTRKVGAELLAGLLNKVFFLAVLGMVLGFSGWIVEILFATPTVHTVRVSTVDEEGNRVEDAEVVASVGYERKEVDGGWEFAIPTGNLPEDRRVVFSGKKQSAFLKGTETIEVNDEVTVVSLILKRDTSAKVRGVVVDNSGATLADVRVMVMGYGGEATTTGADGSFELPAHAAEGQQVELHVQKEGFEAITQWHPAGKYPATLTLTSSP